MFVVAAKAGIGFALILAILGAVQTQSLTDPLLLFVTVGLIPGTNFEIAPEVVLLAVGAALMAMIVLFFRSHNAYHAKLDSIMPEYVHNHDDPDYLSLVPGLRALSLAGRSAMAAANEASTELYFWFRSFGRPAIAQAVISRRGLGSVLFRLDRWANFKLEIRTGLEKVAELGRDWAERAKSYLVRLTIL